VIYLVQIKEIEEKAARPSDAARWGQSVVTLLLEESTPGAPLGSLHGHSLASLSDVALAALADGQLLTYDSTTGTWINEAPAASAAAIPPGVTAAYAGLAAPAGWLPCDGTAVSRDTYAALFAAIGVLHGAGDGSTTFNLPDYRGRVVAGVDAGQAEFNVVGKTSGAKTHLLTAAESGLPAHTHGELTIANSAFLLAGGAAAFLPVPSSTTTGANGAASAASAHNNLQPSIAQLWIIKT
jgi:microcystin-dependent protein